MARYRHEQARPGRLLMDPERFEALLLKQREAGMELIGRSVSSRDDYELLKNDYRRWHDTNAALLARAFDTPHQAEAYKHIPWGSTNSHWGAVDWVEHYKNETRKRISALDGVLERLDMFHRDEPAEPPGQPAGAESQWLPGTLPQTIINVHGGTVNLAQTARGDISQTINQAPGIDEVRRLLDQLEEAIRELEAPEEEITGFLEPVEQLQKELRSKRPLTGRLVAGWGAIKTIGAVESAWQGWDRVKSIALAVSPLVQELIGRITSGS
jgi:hypothetical protein